MAVSVNLFCKFGMIIRALPKRVTVEQALSFWAHVLAGAHDLMIYAQNALERSHDDRPNLLNVLRNSRMEKKSYS